MGVDIQRQVAVIVPAFNEAERISIVLRAVIASKLATEIIVVSDGSTDGTADVARQFGEVKVIDLQPNRGKAAAMQEGVRSTKAKIIAFVDADLDGLQSVHVDRIILPVLSDDCEMCIGVFRGGKRWSDAAHRVSPFLSGQRAMKRWLFESVPDLGEKGMGVETALTVAARREKARVLKVVLRGVSNCHKEQKLGLMKGLAARTKMFREISAVVVKSGRKKRRAKYSKDWRLWEPHEPRPGRDNRHN